MFEYTVTATTFGSNGRIGSAQVTLTGKSAEARKALDELAASVKANPEITYDEILAVKASARAILSALTVKQLGQLGWVSYGERKSTIIDNMVSIAVGAIIDSLIIRRNI